jgi:hypothetical protein
MAPPYYPANMPQAQSLPRHEANFPPKCLADLTRTDMDLLASTLIPFTGLSDTNRTAHRKHIKNRISVLPTHLKANGPAFLSDHCSLHTMLSPLLMTNILNIIRAEIDNDIDTFWQPLAQNGHLSAFKCELICIAQNLSVLWLGPEQYKRRHGIEPRRTLIAGKKASRCAACILTAMGDLQTLLALSSLLIGRLQPRVWSVSKRVQWYEAWISASTTEQKDKYSMLMWNVGTLMREARLRAKEGKPMVDESGHDVVAKRSRVQPVDLPAVRPNRPRRSPRQEGDVEFVRQREIEETIVEEQSAGGAQHTDTEDDRSTVGTAESTSDKEEPPACAWRIASSVYSRAIDADTRSRIFTQPAATQSEVDNILSLYRRSGVVPEDFEIDTFHDDIPPVPALPLNIPQPIQRKPLPLRPPSTIASSSKASPPKERKKPSQGLEDVTIPRRMSLSDSLKRRNWKGKFTDRAPRLRVNKKGEVKGPFDSDSPQDNSPKSGRRF